MGRTEILSDESAIRCHNPATGELIGEYGFHSREQGLAAIASAREAQPEWAALDLAGRRRHVDRLRRCLIDQADDLAAVISDNVGKTRLEALATEVLPSVMAAGYYARKARRWLRPRRLREPLLFANKKSVLHRIPHGVIGIIAPWNYPFGIPMHEIITALLAGNTVVFKTAPETVPVGRAIERLFRDAGMPAGVFHHLNMLGPPAGDTFLDTDRGVDKLFFTGSGPVGKLLMRKAADSLTPVSLELGGKDAMIVCVDAHLDRAVNGALWGGMQNAGQTCGGVERVYVHRAIYENFVERLAEGVERLRLGPPNDPDTDMGAIATAAQHRKVLEHIDQALADGARIAARKELPDGAYAEQMIPPTVLVDVTHDMTIMREETFGPVLGVIPVNDVEEAIRLANESHLGLTASVWTGDRRRGRRIADRLHAGVVTVNDHLLSHGMPNTPWGGFRESGLGRSHGAMGFEEATDTRVVIDERLPFLKRNVFWLPYGKPLYDGLKGAMVAIYGTGAGRRLVALARFVRVLPRMAKK